MDKSSYLGMCKLTMLFASVVVDGRSTLNMFDHNRLDDLCRNYELSFDVVMDTAMEFKVDYRSYDLYL